MKKTLLIAGLLLSSFFTVNAQVLQSENFNALTVGNIGTDITGMTAGQGGFFTQSSAGGTNAAASNFQIVADNAAHANVLQVTGSDAATGNKFVWKDGLGAAWTARTTGNNIVELEFSFFTGAATASTSVLRPVIYSEAGTIIGGYNFNVNTKRLDGFAYGDFNNTGTPGNYTITLRTGGLILPASTWVKVGFAYNTTTGLFTWKCNDVTPVVAGTIAGSPGYVPDEFDVIYIAGTLNAVASSARFDDLSVKATATENLLTVQNVAYSKFSVYPNPTNGLVTISNDENSALQSVNITDLNGRTVKSLKLNGEANSQINISDLSAGVYMMNIASDQGTVTKKIVKN